MGSLMYGRVFCLFVIKIDGAHYFWFVHTFRVPYSQFNNITYNFVLLTKIMKFFFLNMTILRLVKWTFKPGYFYIHKQSLRAIEVDAYIKAYVVYKTLKIFFHALIFWTPSSCLPIAFQIFACSCYWKRRWWWASVSFVVLSSHDQRNLIHISTSRYPEYILPPRVSAMGTFEY